MYPKIKCPFCGREHELSRYINVLCPCGIEEILREMMWLGRSSAKKAYIFGEED